MNGLKPSLVHRDDIAYRLSAPYNTILTVQDCQEIFELLQETTRNPNHCISKGQYAKLVEQLAARNKMLEKRVAELTVENMRHVTRIDELEAAAQ